MDDVKRHYLEIMGIQRWVLREPQQTVVAQEPEREEVVSAADRQLTQQAEFVTAEQPSPVAGACAPEDVAVLDWQSLRQRVSQCTVCDELVANRTQTVFGVGNQQADWMVIGEAPGADEDRQGEPFVGRAGQLLNAMLHGLGLKREQVYIANILKCRPPNNRDPKPEEAQACSAFLQRQIALLQPKVIVAVGRIAAQNLLHSDVPIGKLRGVVHRHESGVPLVVTYHPAYLLRSPLEKRKAWGDLCLARKALQEPTVGTE